MKDKNELIIDIINIYEENTKLKNELEKIKNQERIRTSREDFLNEQIAILGLTKMVETVSSDYSMKDKIKIEWSDDDQIDYVCTSFENWLKKIIDNMRDIPEFMSKNEFLELSREVYKIKYESYLKEAIKRFKNENGLE